MSNLSRRRAAAAQAPTKEQVQVAFLRFMNSKEFRKAARRAFLPGWLRRWLGSDT